MNKVKIGVIGYGSIGSKIAGHVCSSLSAWAELSGVYDINRENQSSAFRELGVSSGKDGLSGVVRTSDLIIETASIEAARDVILACLPAGKDVLIVSTGVFVKYPELLSMIDSSGSRLFIPSGAVCGIDGLAGLKKGKIKSVKLVTSKPPDSFEGLALLKRLGINPREIKEEETIFRGDIKTAIQEFPQNINVAATLFLATRFPGIEVVIKADPGLSRNKHYIEVRAEEAEIIIQVENIPSPDNPKTSYLTILSIQAVLEKIFVPLKVGT